MIKEEQATSGHEHQHQQVQAENTPTMRDVLKNRNFLKLWLAQIVSQTAQQIVNFALVQHVFQLTGSSTAVGGVIIAFTVPGILFAAIAGVFVERNSKRTMLVATNIARGVLVLGYIFTDKSWGGGAVLPLIYTVTLLFSAVSQFFSPAEASMIPMVVKKEELVAANSLFNLTLTGTTLGGFVILGPLLIRTVFNQNFTGLYIVICILCLAAAAVTYFLPKDKPLETMAELLKGRDGTAVHTTKWGMFKSGIDTAWGELIEGWSFIRKDRTVASAIIYWSIAVAVFMMLGTIGPGFLVRVLGIDAFDLLYVLLPGGIGLVIGVILVGRISNESNREDLINRSLLAAGVTLVIFALIQPVTSWIFSMANITPPSWLMLALMGGLTLVLGGFNSAISVLAQTALQERSPEEIRARVFSAFYTVSNAILLVPVFFAGALADSLGYVQTVTAIGVVVALIAGFGFYRMKHRTAPETRPLSIGGVTPEEAEAALTIGSPAPRPLTAATEQQGHHATTQE
jgi:MFS family permease